MVQQTNVFIYGSTLPFTVKRAMKKKLTLFALIIIAAGFALAATPAIKNFEPYTIKAYAPPTTKPLTQPQTTQHYNNPTPTQETCQTDQNVDLGQEAYVCRRFDENHNIETGSLDRKSTRLNSSHYS